MANGSVEEYGNLNSISIGDYLVRFKIFIDKIETTHEENERVAAQNRIDKK